MVAGAVALVFLVQILPGSSVPARALAGFVVGESDATSAAAIVAGQGDRFDAAALRATLALAADDAFIKDYKSCIERAKKASEQTRCTLRFPQVN